MIISERLTQLRKQRGLIQKDVAEAMGLDRTTYTKYERGDIKPSYETILKLADYFNVSIDYLLGKTNTPGPQIETEEELAFWEMRKEMAQRPEMRVLFSLARTATTKDLKLANEMLRRLTGGAADE